MKKIIVFSLGILLFFLVAMGIPALADSPDDDPQVTLDDLLKSSYAILLGQSNTTQGAIDSLKEQFSERGYNVSQSGIEISVENISTGAIETTGYGTFDFTITSGPGIDGPIRKRGYIVSGKNHVIFKLVNGDQETILVATHADSSPREGEFEVPQMASGTMEIFGYGNILAMPFDNTILNEDGKVNLPFYRAQFHINSPYGQDPDSKLNNLNLYGFYVIQADAYCVKVAATGQNSREEKTQTWDLGRYADLTLGETTSKVFFGNENFILALPSTSIGAIDVLEATTGSFIGYNVSDNEDGTYTVKFLSNYYDKVTIDLKINNTVIRKLHIHRVGVNIQEYGSPHDDVVFHGTQYATKINYDDGSKYRIYGTYYIPGGGNDAPYGLAVTYTWDDGSTSTKIISQYCTTPDEYKNADVFKEGVFIYNEEEDSYINADACDYLLYSGTSSSGGPKKINVLVLKGDPIGLVNSNNFAGISFGSGLGVTWEKSKR